ncbi:MAG: hypothetical protein ACFFDF_12545, partial [Candidatus Odinarchaeota archaeon]
MNKEIENQYQNIISNFPNIIPIENEISHIKIELNNGIILEINFSKYPKKPKVKLINQSGEVYKKLNDDIISLQEWK